MPATADDVAPNEWECRVFIAVAEHSTYTAAADHLSAQIGRTYGRRAVSEVVKKIEHWLKEPAFVGMHHWKRTTPRGEEFLHDARSIVAEYRLMRDRAPATEVPVLACLPHHVHFVARAQAMLVAEPPAGREKVTVQYLEQQHRGHREFNDYVVHRLRRDAYQLIVGPPVTEDRALVSKDLYVARLEAMIPEAYDQETVSLTDLIQNFRLLLPPEQVRSRRLLEEKIVEWDVPDPRRNTRVAGESHETATCVLRLRNEEHLAHDSRAVVAPSDVALVFKQQWDFGGRHADRFRWVPIVHLGPDGRTRLLEDRVSVTTRRSEAAKFFPVINALRAAVSQIPELSGAASGRRTSQRVPGQRGNTRPAGRQPTAKAP